MNTSEYRFNNVEGVCFVGDVHGEWQTLGYKACVQYNLEYYVIVQLGDFGIGFHSEEYNKVELKKLNSKLKKKNNHLVVLRGNHDSDLHFDGEYSKQYSNIHLVPDYTVLGLYCLRDVPDDGINSTEVFRSVLCIGGGLSVDRTERWKWEAAKPGRKYYWENEMPVYDESKLDEINKIYPHDIDVVATHTAPSFVYPFTKTGIHHWLIRDMQLKDEVERERKIMDDIFRKLLGNQERLTEWYYGHFHATQTTKIDNISFNLLDICEFREKRIDL